MANPRQVKRSHYRLLGLVGHGQYGRVYCALHRKTGELVALKDLNRYRFPTHKFLRELRFLLSLEHPHIATCQALEHSATGRQLVLDYCEGGTLRYLLDEQVPLSLDDMLTMLIDVLSALDHAHRQGIIHCDIKPENILLKLTPTGWTVKISDFGIARLSQETSDAETGATGSPAYMAPERFYNRHSAACDLYATGIIFYEMLTGQRPFSGTPNELMVAHLNQVPKIPESVPPAVAAILRKSLEKLLARRYKTALEMQADLMALRQSDSAERLQYHLPLTECLPPVVDAPALPFVTLPHPVSVMGLVKWSVNPELSGFDQETIQAMEASSTLLLTCHQQQGWFYRWTAQDQSAVRQSRSFSLAGNIRQFIPLDQGGCLFTDQSIHLLSMQRGLGTLARFDHSVKAVVDPNCRWFAACYRNGQSDQVELMFRRLTLQPEQPVKTAHLKRVGLTAKGTILALAAVDKHHLMMAVQEKQTTELHFFTRRGTYMGALSLASPLKKLVATHQTYRFLATEAACGNSLLVIDVKPFRVLRYRLDIDSDWLFDTVAGYCLVNRQGQLRVIDAEGQILGRVKGLPQPSAIIQSSPDQLLWATSEARHSRIYTVNLKDLGLDVIF